MWETLELSVERAHALRSEPRRTGGQIVSLVRAALDPGSDRLTSCWPPAVRTAPVAHWDPDRIRPRPHAPQHVSLEEPTFYAQMDVDDGDENAGSDAWDIEQEPGFCDETRRSRARREGSRTRTRGVR